MRRIICNGVEQQSVNKGGSIRSRYPGLIRSAGLVKAWDLSQGPREGYSKVYCYCICFKAKAKPVAIANSGKLYHLPLDLEDGIELIYLATLDLDLKMLYVYLVSRTDLSTQISDEILKISTPIIMSTYYTRSSYSPSTYFDKAMFLFVAISVPIKL